MSISVVGWRAYYPDGETVNSRETDPTEIEDGIAGLVQFYDETVPSHPDRPYRDLVTGGDWYTWDGERWSIVPSHPEPGEWVSREAVEEAHPDRVLVKSCENLADDAWQILRGLMREDYEVP